MSKIIEMIDDFRFNQEILGRKPKYIESCMYRLKMFKDFLETLEVFEVEDVKPIHVKKFIKERQNLGRENNRTINNTLSTMRVFFNYLVEEEFIGEFENPIRKIKNLKEDNKVIVTFNDDEVSRIINGIKEDTYSNIRDKLILIFLFDTGVRVSELCDIKQSEVSTRHILIHGKGSKQRLVYISRIMRKYMRLYEKARNERFKNKQPDEIEDYYFLDQSAMRLSRSRINTILRENCIRAKVRKDVRCSPHDCRHYFAQKQLRNGIDVYSLSRLLGHYDTQITSKYLRGMEQDDILYLGRVHSPLRDVHVKRNKTQK
ncbi:tyrosine-type recombinase/integrase [Bacillus massiliigorillae]|uniref:tyrosine-type recombinase/integrase n=1 Tax=Bacillus massiliigorillae TaxID=1243664 RepID=UPI00039A13BC|nr:tyrosine-type recombinase/integrase [Bacillus massiliigorillae]